MTVDRCQKAPDGNHVYQPTLEGGHECVYCEKYTVFMDYPNREWR